MEKSQKLGYAGAALLAIGLFTPVVSFLGILSVSLSQSTLDLILILALAAATGFFTYQKTYKALWGTGLVALGWLVFRFIDLQSSLSGASGLGSGDGLPGGLVGGGIVSLSWGWVVLGLGAGLTLAAAATGSRKSSADDMAMSAGR